MSKIVTAFLITILLSSCVKKEEFDFDRLAKTSWTPQVGFPLVRSKMGVQDLMGNTDSNAVTTDPNGLVVLKYDGGEEVISAVDFISFPESVIVSSKTGVPVTPGGPYPVPIPFKNPRDTNVIFTKLVIESGTMDITFNSGDQANATFEFPTLKSSAGTVVRTAVPMNGKASVGLVNHTLELNAQGQFIVNIEIPTVPSGRFANAVFELKNIVYKRIEGDFKSRVVQLPQDSVRLHIFKNLSGQGELVVEDPRIRINIDNEFGIPLALNLGSLKAYYSVPNSTSPLLKTGQETFNVIDGSVQSPGLTKIVLDKSNSVISEALQATPVLLQHSIKAEANPGGSSSNLNVLERDAKFKVRTILELPLSGRIKGLSLMDTIPFAINESFDYIENLALNTSIRNGFPFTISLSLRLVDSNYKQVFTEKGTPVYLFKDRQIATSGIVDDNTGKIDQTNLPSVINIYQLGNEETKSVLNGKHVIIEGRLETFKDGSVNVAIYDNYIFDLKVGVKITGNLTF